MKQIATINLASESIYHNSVAIDDYDAGEDSQVDPDLCFMHIKKKMVKIKTCHFIRVPVCSFRYCGYSISFEIF